MTSAAFNALYVMQCTDVLGFLSQIFVLHVLLENIALELQTIPCMLLYVLSMQILYSADLLDEFGYVSELM